MRIVSIFILILTLAGCGEAEEERKILCENLENAEMYQLAATNLIGEMNENHSSDMMTETLTKSTDALETIQSILIKYKCVEISEK